MENEIKNTLASCYTHIENAYDKLESMGATMPAEKNIKNLRDTIYTLDLDIDKYKVTFDDGTSTNIEEVYPGQTVKEPTNPVKEGCMFLYWYEKPTPLYDPENPTLEGLKAALDSGDKEAFKPNTIIPDTYKGEEFNWVVGSYGLATMSDMNVKEGVYLFSDKIVVQSLQFDPNSAYYNESNVHEWLNGYFFSNCSDTMKSLVGEISVTGSDFTHAVNAKVWLMSVAEVMGELPSSSNGGGTMWDAWKIRTGLSLPSTAANDGRIVEYNGINQYWWTRSFASSSSVYYVSPYGGIGSYNISSSCSIIPAFFMPKSESGPISVTEYNAKAITAEDYNSKNITTKDFNTNAKGKL